MPQFFETIMGRKFFNSQLPALIRAIEKLGSKPEMVQKSMQVKADCVSVTVNDLHEKGAIVESVTPIEYGPNDKEYLIIYREEETNDDKSGAVDKP